MCDVYTCFIAWCTKSERDIGKTNEKIVGLHSWGNAVFAVIGKQG